MSDFAIHDSVTIITLDDSKANAVGHQLIDTVNSGLDRSLNEAQAVLITGRKGVFSAGFDLKEFENGPEATAKLVNRGAEMLLRIFCHPQPVVMACTGHAVAAGAFMLLAADTRIGTAGDFRIGLNETAIGMTLPEFGLQLVAARLSMRHQTAAVIQAQLFAPKMATDVGFLDQVVAEGEVLKEAMQQAVELAKLPQSAYAANKIASRAEYITAIRNSL